MNLTVINVPYNFISEVNSKERYESYISDLLLNSNYTVSFLLEFDDTWPLFYQSENFSVDLSYKEEVSDIVVIDNSFEVSFYNLEYLIHKVCHDLGIVKDNDINRNCLVLEVQDMHNYSNQHCRIGKEP